MGRCDLLLLSSVLRGSTVPLNGRDLGTLSPLKGFLDHDNDHAVERATVSRSGSHQRGVQVVGQAQVYMLHGTSIVLRWSYVQIPAEPYG
jgi:hypothetical protein